ncbi:DUF445 family protein [Paraburkholderia sp. CI3]|uniref:DUF445 family protein n=1 Tax=Paraburkholderia sp. CI3 TaxID=2991060 RepID=UPI003D19FC65
MRRSMSLTTVICFLLRERKKSHPSCAGFSVRRGLEFPDSRRSKREPRFTRYTGEPQGTSFDPYAVSRKIEAEIGRDLQYVRINGTLVGGMAGVLLHAATFVVVR